MLWMPVVVFHASGTRCIGLLTRDINFAVCVPSCTKVDFTRATEAVMTIQSLICKYTNHQPPNVGPQEYLLHDDGSTHTQDADITTGSVSTQANTVTPTSSDQQGHYKVSHSKVADHCSITLPTAPRKRPSSSVLTPDSLDRATRPVLATSRMPAEQQNHLSICSSQCMRLHISLPVRLFHHAESASVNSALEQLNG